MLAEVEILVLPYSSAAGRSVLHILIDALRNGGWNSFRAAIAFAKTGGNYSELLDALATFADAGNAVSITFGADVFAGNAKGSDYEAIREILESLGQKETVRFFLYHEVGRTFHPKVFLFGNEGERRAMAIIGSSNWSDGGLVKNVEANVRIEFDLADDAHRAAYDELVRCFQTYWSEQ